MKCVKYDDLIDKLMTCAYSFKRVETWEDIINIINEVPTFVAVPAPNYRVPSKEEWMELVLSLIAAMSIGICITLVGIERDLREILDNMHEFEEEKKEE